MKDRKIRLALAVFAVVLPGPWTPVVLLAYVLHRATGTTGRAHASTTERPAHHTDTSTTATGAPFPAGGGR